MFTKILHRASPFFLKSRADRVAAKSAVTTVDQSDIRGSNPKERQHSQSPSGAASDYERESGPKPCHIDETRILHSACPLAAAQSALHFIVPFFHRWPLCIVWLRRFLSPFSCLTVFYVYCDGPHKTEKLSPPDETATEFEFDTESA